MSSVKKILESIRPTLKEDKKLSNADVVFDAYMHLLNDEGKKDITITDVLYYIKDHYPGYDQIANDIPSEAVWQVFIYSTLHRKGIELADEADLEEASNRLSDEELTPDQKKALSIVSQVDPSAYWDNGDVLNFRVERFGSVDDVIDRLNQNLDAHIAYIESVKNSIGGSMVVDVILTLRGNEE